MAMGAFEQVRWSELACQPTKTSSHIEIFDLQRLPQIITYLGSKPVGIVSPNRVIDYGQVDRAERMKIGPTRGVKSYIPGEISQHLPVFFSTP